MVDIARAAGRPDRRWRPYTTVLTSRMRAQRSYRAGFRLDMASSALVAVVESAEVLVLFHRAGVLGGLNLRQIVLVFGLADLAFALADMTFGHVDELPRSVRTGRLDVFYLRPQPVLAQLVTSEIHLRRLARATIASIAVAAGLALAGVPLTPRTLLLVVVAVVRHSDLRSSVRRRRRPAVLPHQRR